MTVVFKSYGHRLECIHITKQQWMQIKLLWSSNISFWFGFQRMSDCPWFQTCFGWKNHLFIFKGKFHCKFQLQIWLFKDENRANLIWLLVSSQTSLVSLVSVSLPSEVQCLSLVGASDQHCQKSKQECLYVWTWTCSRVKVETWQVTLTSAALTAAGVHDISWDYREMTLHLQKVWLILPSVDSHNFKTSFNQSVHDHISVPTMWNSSGILPHFNHTQGWTSLTHIKLPAWVTPLLSLGSIKKFKTKPF